MPNINLHITNASQHFTPAEIKAIKNAVVLAESFIKSHFTFDYPVDIVVHGKSRLMATIPEDGITGRTYDSRFIIIVIDKSQHPVTESSVYETICHELSHSLRWEKLPEYSANLFQGMILEGLAIALEEKALNELQAATPQFFLKSITETTDAEYEAMINQLQSDFETADYDYETIFFTGDETLPRWAGYRLGYYYVKQYLQATGRTIEQATLDSYALFTYK